MHDTGLTPVEDCPLPPSPNANRLTFAPGSILFEEGQPGDSAYLIVSGKVEIRIGTRSSSPRTLGTCGKGEVIGELALFDEQAHLGTAVAIENTTVIPMSRAEFRKRVDGMDPVMRAIVLLMVRRHRHTVWELKPQSTDVNWGDWKREKSK